MTFLEALYKAYEQKISARTSLQKDFHSWMTFYSVATGAILIAYNTTTVNESQSLQFIIIGFGLITSFLWFLSCKGYRHWTEHWIKEIQKFETDIITELVNNKGDKEKITFETIENFWIYTNQPKHKKVIFFKPFDDARISTPKATLAFSFFTNLGWQILLVRQISKLHIFCIIFNFAFFVCLIIIVLVIINAFFFLWLCDQLYSIPAERNEIEKEKIRKLIETQS